MQTNNRWKQFKKETNTNIFKKKELTQNSRWKRDDRKQTENKFKKPRINSRFDGLLSSDKESENSRFRNSEPERREDLEIQNLKEEEDLEIQNLKEKRTTRNRFKSNGFRNNGRFRNNRRFDKRPSRIRQDIRGNMVLPVQPKKV